jgi:hypothetical protein
VVAQAHGRRGASAAIGAPSLEYYTRVALQRGVQGARNSERKMKYGEAYQRVFPWLQGNCYEVQKYR